MRFAVFKPICGKTVGWQRGS